MPGRNFSESESELIAQAAEKSPQKAVAAKYGCSLSTVSRIVASKRSTGKAKSKPLPVCSHKVTRRSKSQVNRTFKKYRRSSHQGGLWHSFLGRSLHHL
ncbi:uncharacterized protein IAS62_006247 [Cryptococcus decagattii]|uniref:HTH psq-type domain-containing protein n=1 Tax=Cryptococcus decagattii TaxID=1859122 RepID=A0ABZ2B269_9TREE